MSRRPRICVVGAGLIGLSTAVALQSSSLDAELTIVADTFSPDTTSDVASGLMFPFPQLNTNQPHLVRRWFGPTYRAYRELFMSERSSEAGISQVSGYLLYSTSGHDMNPSWKDLVDNFRVLTPADIEKFPGAKEGMFFTTFLCEPTDYLQWLTKQFKKENGKMIRRKLTSLEEIGAEFDLIVNCSGVGARQLVGDDQVVPMRGQTVWVRAPWIKCFYMYDDCDTYVIPRAKTAAIGGVNHKANSDRTISAEDNVTMLQKAYRLIPSTRAAELLTSVVGVRPTRKALRLERGDDIRCGGRAVPVVHNYGHGGSGYSFSVGCAQEVVEIIKGVVANNMPQKAKL